MEDKKKEVRATEPLKSKTEIKKQPEWKIKICRVVKYVPEYGSLGFMFDDIPCQINIPKNLKIYGTVNIKYCGEIDKGIKFKY